MEVIFKFLLNIGWTILVILENIFLLNMLKLIEIFPREFQDEENTHTNWLTITLQISK